MTGGSAQYLNSFSGGIVPAKGSLEIVCTATAPDTYRGEKMRYRIVGRDNNGFAIDKITERIMLWSSH
jgi:hypothetical protein